MAVAEQTAGMINHHLDIQLVSKDIDVAHRLGKYVPNKNRPVIVKCVRRQTKIDVMQRANRLKGTNIYVNDDLTKTNAEVLASLRLKDPGRVERAWSRESKLFVKYRGSERSEKVLFDQYKNWLSKPWPKKESTTYAKKASSGANLRSPVKNS